MKISKLTILRLIKTIVFLAGFAGLTALFSYMLLPKSNARGEGIINPNARGFYGEPKNSIDIMVIGNSDAYSAFSPMELWNSYGYTSYISAEGSSSIGETYNMLQEVLECQQPKLVILETDCLWNGVQQMDRLEKNITSTWERKIPLLRYHDRWKWVKSDTFFDKPEYKDKTVSKGQLLSKNVTAYEGGDYMEVTAKEEPVPRSALPWLDRLLSLCEENNIQVMFVEMPSADSWNYGKHMAMAEYADDAGVTFIDMNMDSDNWGLDWSTDSRDGGNHLNVYGAMKVTTYLGNYISQNYSISDKRNDSDYADWNDCYKKYQTYLTR